MNDRKYVREHVDHARKKITQQEFECALLEGLESGEPVPVTPEFWEKRRRELARRLGTGDESAKDN